MPMVGAVVHLDPSTPDRTDILEVIERTGISATRDEIQWGDIEQKQGVYQIEEQYKKKLDFLADAGLEGMLLFADGNKLYNGGTVSVKLDSVGLTVLTDKQGGTLVWNGKKYTLVPNEEINLRSENE